MIISEEKYKQREVLDKLNGIEVMKIGGVLDMTTELDLNSTSEKVIKPQKQELLIDFIDKLVVNQEREFSSGLYDIKIYERNYKGDNQSYRFKLSLAPPRHSDTFIVDFECEIQSRKNRVLIETISLEDKNLNSSKTKSIVFTSSIVLCIFENSFPHYVEFILFEPSTKAEWNHKIASNTLSPLVLKEKFVKLICRNIKEGPYRKWNTARLIRVSCLTYENINALALDDRSWDGSVLDQEVAFNISNILNPLTKTESTIKKPNLYFYKGNFKQKIESNFEDEDIDGHDKFHQIFRKYI